MAEIRIAIYNSRFETSKYYKCGDPLRTAEKWLDKKCGEDYHES